MDKSEVEEQRQIKSISRDTTFPEDTADFHQVLNTLDKLAEEVHNDLIKQQLLFRTVTVRVRYENFETHTHSKTLPFITNRLQDIQKTAKELIQAYLKPERKIRLIGVRVSNFISAEKQKTLNLTN
jgi:nucleotidyltransferase/DNA polymerase involved in DNA repair